MKPMLKKLYYKNGDFDERVPYIDYTLEYEAEITDKICLDYLRCMGCLNQEQAEWVYDNLASGDPFQFDDAVSVYERNRKDWEAYLKECFLDGATKQYYEDEEDY